MTDTEIHRRIPLIVGVTGHQRLVPEDAGRVVKQLTSYLAELKSKYPHTPLLLMSAMSEGADRLAAQVATGIEGVELVVVLPWPEGMADDLWHRSGDRGEFDDLLGKARHRICLPLPDCKAGTDIRTSEKCRQECYAEVGRFLTRHSHVLVAIWNGKKHPESQTWQMVQWQLGGTVESPGKNASQLDEPETGPLKHLPVRRGAEDPSVLYSTEPTLQQTSRLAGGFDGIAASFEEFNRDATRLGPKMTAEMATAKGWVIPAADQPALPEHVRFMLDRFALPDRLSAHWQTWSIRMFVAILVCIFLTVAAFEIYAHLLPGEWGWLLAYPLLFVCGVAVTRAAKRMRVFNRYLDYRALAEALRVHLFWKLAGLRENAADFYLRSYRSHLDWIRAALRAWSVESGEHHCRCGHAEMDASQETTRLEQVQERWIKDQLDFFNRNGPRDHHKAHRWHMAARVFLGLSLIATLWQIIRLLLADTGHGHLGHDHLTHSLIVAIAMCGLLAGLCHEYLEKRLFEKQARSYKWMESLYQTARTRFKALLEHGDAARARELILELGREALAENADWVIYHREHEPEMKGH